MNKKFYIGDKEIEYTNKLSYKAIQQEGYLRVILGDSTFNIIVENINTDSKTVNLSINNILYQVSIKHSLDELLESMGMDLKGSKKIKEIKSPMPGRVLKLLKSVGDSVKANEGVLILGAMKMENIIKSEGSGIIKELHVSPERIVNKGELLVTFE